MGGTVGTTLAHTPTLEEEAGVDAIHKYIDRVPFLAMAAMPCPLWSSHNDNSLASFTFTSKFGLLYMGVSLLSFSTHLAIPYV